MQISNVTPTSSTLDTVVAGTTVGMGRVFLGTNFQKVRGLSAKVTVTAATATITIAAKWQVSDDGATYFDVANGSQNAAAVVLATGTASAVTKVIPAPDAIFGWKYARIALVTGVATGGATDTYVVSYYMHVLTGHETGL